jgi:hypothetical protein
MPYGAPLIVLTVRVDTLVGARQLIDVASILTKRSAVTITSDAGNPFVLTNILPPPSIFTSDPAFLIDDCMLATLGGGYTAPLIVDIPTMLDIGKITLPAALPVIGAPINSLGVGLSNTDAHITGCNAPRVEKASTAKPV